MGGVGVAGRLCELLCVDGHQFSSGRLGAAAVAAMSVAADSGRQEPLEARQQL